MEEKNVIINKNGTINVKIDVLNIIKNMSEEEQEKLVNWFIEKINKKDC